MSGLGAVLPESVQETLQSFWESPFPASLQDEHFRLIDVNAAFLELSGYAREDLLSRDPVELAKRALRRPLSLYEIEKIANR